MKSLAYIAIIALLATVGAVAQNKQMLFPDEPVVSVKVSTTYADNQKDTLVYLREPGVSGLTFSVHNGDSVRFANDSGCVVMRIFDNTAIKVAGDTLNFSSIASTVDGSAAELSLVDGGVTYGNVAITPYCDKIMFIVKYFYGGNGTTSPTVVYKLHKVYSGK